MIKYTGQNKILLTQEKKKKNMSIVGLCSFMKKIIFELGPKIIFELGTLLGSTVFSRLQTRGQIVIRLAMFLNLPCIHESVGKFSR